MGAATISVGTVLQSKYRVDRLLGEGGMGYVVAATHLRLGPVAIKFLHLAEAEREDLIRFAREARAAAKLKGPHVARVIDVEEQVDGAPPFIVMELLDGMDLKRVLKERHQLPAGEAVDWILQTCDALAEAHALGIVHRDIKPANIFLASTVHGEPMVKVVDFGISKLRGDEHEVVTRSTTAMGTPAYMSPEQMRSSRDVDPRTDIWALGVVLHECIVGERPFQAETVQALCGEVLAGSPRPMPPSVSPALRAVVARCLAKDPSLRFPDIASLVAALVSSARRPLDAAMILQRTRALAGAVVTAPLTPVGTDTTTDAVETTTLQAGAMSVRRRPLSGSRALALGTAVAVVVGAGTLSLLRLDRRSRGASSQREPKAVGSAGPGAAEPRDEPAADAHGHDLGGPPVGDSQPTTIPTSAAPPPEQRAATARGRARPPDHEPSGRAAIEPAADHDTPVSGPDRDPGPPPAATTASTQPGPTPVSAPGSATAPVPAVPSPAGPAKPPRLPPVTTDRNKPLSLDDVCEDGSC